MRLGAVAAPSGSESDQAKRIREAALASYASRNRYTEQQVATSLKLLEEAESEVKHALQRYATLGELAPNQRINERGLEGIREHFRETMTELRRDSTLLARDYTKTAYKNGVHAGIEDLVQAKLPLYRDLDADGVLKTAGSAFAVMDTHALDFLMNFNVQLTGEVTRELADGIQRTIGLGIAQGKGIRELVRDLGGVVKDPDAFRKAGKTVFKTAQQRLTVIARTETLRAHNQGRIKFYDHVGVGKLEWLAVGDERQCKICGGLNGRVFPIDKLPTIPAHAQCRCSVLPAEPLDVCGEELASQAATKSCLLSPQTIQEQASQKHGEAIKVGKKAAEGKYDELTLKQLQGLAKDNDISLYMSPADFRAKLDLLEPGVDHSGLKGKALMAKVAQYKIGKTKTKEDLIAALKTLNTHQLKVTKDLAEQAKAPVEPPAQMPAFDGMSLKQLQQEAKNAGLSIYPTKAEYVKWLDELEPGVNHAAMSGKVLAAKKKEFGLGKVKIKDQLIADLKAAHLIFTQALQQRSQYDQQGR